MKYRILLLILVIGSLNLQAQTFRKIPPVVCPMDPNSYDTRVRLPEHLRYLIGENARVEEANDAAIINVNYSGFTTASQAAFQFAVDIWAASISSPVVINVDAQFSGLGTGILGSAGPGVLVRDFKNAPFDTTFYHIALAEKMAGKELNLTSDPDIVANFNNTANWYLGTDGNTPSGMFDFVTVVLHELGHGLGFTGADDFDTSTNIGTWDLFNLRTLPYNIFVELEDGVRLIDIPNGTIQVGDALTGDSLFFNGPLAVSSLGERPRLYAPTSYNSGSSFSHLDEATYPAGSLHSLMTPQFGSGESIHNPGITLDIFADLGWLITVLDHEPQVSIVDNLLDDILVETNIRTDTDIVNEDLYAVYSYDNLATLDSVKLVDQGNSLFSGNIPNSGVNGTVKYFIRGLEDGLGREITSPSNAPYNSYLITIHDQALVAVSFESADGGDFESGDAGFFSIPVIGDINLWELGEPTNTLVSSSSPTNVWKTDLNANLFQGEKTYSSALVSPYFDLLDEAANYDLSFELAMDLGQIDDVLFESGPILANVEVSNDQGVTWDLLGDINDGIGENWYNFHGDFLTGSGWVFENLTGQVVTYNISSLAGNDSVLFRVVVYVLQDFLAQGYESDGVLLDNFGISKGSPTAAFRVIGSGGVIFPGENIEFEYVSSGATSFLWDFGDGTTSTDENPIHDYTFGGVFDVSLTIQSADGTDTVIKEDVLTIISQKGSSYSLEDGGDFEANVSDFIPVNISGTGFERGNSNVVGKNGTVSGNFAWVTGISDDQYVDQSEAFLYTPLFDFRSLGEYTLSFSANYNTEFQWDGFIVEYTTDRGETWLQLEPEVDDNWYDEFAESNPSQGWPAIPLFSGDSEGYVQKSRDISSLGGNPDVGFRFHWKSDFAEVGVGISIDDFALTGPELGPAVPDFSSTLTGGCVNTAINFVNETGGAFSSIEWSFGAGADPETASGIGPHRVRFPEAGVYTITLTVEGLDNGTQIEEKTNFISIGEFHTPTISSENQPDGLILLTASAGEAYQWFFENDSIIGANSQTLLVEETGSYSVSVKVTGCTTFSPDLVTAIDDEELISIIVYPNPVSANNINFRITDNRSGPIRFNFLDLSGKIVKSLSDVKSSAIFNQSYDVSTLVNGIYFVSIEIGDEPLTVRKIILSR